MWNDITIGTGNSGNSAVRVFSIKGKHSISVNSQSYWITDFYFDIRLIIFKNTDEGKVLSNMIENETPLDEINGYIGNIIFRNITLDKLKNLIESKVQDAYNKGSEERAYTIRTALGVD